MPANFKFNAENLDRVRSFFNSQSIQHQTAVRKKVVIEFRDPSWRNHSALGEIEKEDILFRSVETPSLPNTIVALNGAIYLRLHGTMTRYSYLYPEQRLREIVSAITSAQAKRKAIYLSNDHGMLHNGL